MKLSIADKLLIQHFFIGKPIKKAYQFASYTRNDANSNSDIDILVELDHTQPIGIKFFFIQNELEDLIKKKNDLVRMGGISKYLQPIIDREKILIYDRATN